MNVDKTKGMLLLFGKKSSISKAGPCGRFVSAVLDQFCFTVVKRRNLLLWVRRG